LRHPRPKGKKKRETRNGKIIKEKLMEGKKI
jgi:hypothetical protein